TRNVQDTRCSGCSLFCETGPVEPWVNCMRRVRVRIAKQQRSSAGNDRRDESDSRGVVTRAGNREWQATIVRCDPRNLPTAQYLAHRIVLRPEERQLVNVIQVHYVLAVKNCAPVLSADVVHILGRRTK